jgi:hypothetical protein
MEQLRQAIISQDYSQFKMYLSSPTEETQMGIGCPLLTLVSSFNENSEVSIGMLMAQELINQNFCTDNCVEYINSQNTDDMSPNIKKLYQFIKNTKVYTNTSSNSNRRFSATSPVQQINTGSNYSAQELLQLKNIASEYNIRYTTTNHLALKIIQYLRSKLHQ